MPLKQTDYLYDALYNPTKVVEKAIRKLQTVDFDTIVVSGVSGLLVGPIVAYEMEKNLVVVRKRDDISTHSYLKIEGALGARWLFLDDTISSGNTRDYVKVNIDELARSQCHKTEYIGYYLWHENRMSLISGGRLVERIDESAKALVEDQPAGPVEEKPPVEKAQWKGNRWQYQNVPKNCEREGEIGVRTFNYVAEQGLYALSYSQGSGEDLETGNPVSEV